MIPWMRFWSTDIRKRDPTCVRSSTILWRKRSTRSSVERFVANSTSSTLVFSRSFSQMLVRCVTRLAEISRFLWRLRRVINLDLIRGIFCVSRRLDYPQVPNGHWCGRHSTLGWSLITRLSVWIFILYEAGFGGLIRFLIFWLCLD